MKSHGYDINGTIPAGSDEEHIGSMAVYMKDEALLKTWFQHGGDPMKQVRGQTLVEDIVGHGSLTMFEAWLDHVGPDRMLHAPTVSGSSVGRLAMLQDVRMAQAWIIRGGCMLAEDHRDVTNALLYGLASTSWDQHPALIMTKQALITALDHDTPSLELMTQAWSHPVARQIAEQSIAHMPDPLDMARWIQSCDIARRRCVRDVDGHLT
jgi:hypothetical protein